MNRGVIQTTAICSVSACIIQIALVWIGIAYGYLVGQPTPPYDGPYVDLIALPLILLVINVPLALFAGMLIGSIIERARRLLARTVNSAAEQ